MSKRKTSTRRNLKNSDSLAKLLIVLLGFCPVFLPLMRNRPELDMITGLLIGFGIIWSIYCWQAARQKPQNPNNPNTQFHFHYLVSGCLALWLWAAFSVLWAVNAFEWFHKMLFFSTAILGLLLAQQLINSVQLIQLLYKGLFVSGLLIALIGICQHLFNVQWFQQAAPPAATFGNKNMAMHYILLTISLGVVLFWHSQRLIESWFYGIAITLMLTYIVYSTTRAAWIAVTVQGLLLVSYALWEYFKNKQFVGFDPSKLKIGLACTALLLLMVHMSADGFNRNAMSRMADDVQSIATESTLKSDSANARWALYANSLLIIRDNPLLGAGFGNWKLTYPIYQQQAILDKLTTEHNQPLKVHNDVIEYVSELGLIGLFIILFIGFWILRTSYQLLSSAALNERLLCIGAFTSLAGIAVDAQFSFPMQLPVPLTLTLLMIAVLAILSRLNTSDSLFLWQPTRKAYRSLSLLMLLLALASSWLLFRWHQSEQAWQKAKVAESRLDFDRIVSYANDSLRWLPWREEAYFFIAFAYQHKGQHVEALALYDKLLKQYPHSSSAQLRAAQSAMLSNQPEKAISVLDQLILNRPYSAEVHKHQGLLYYNYLNDKGKGVDYFESALQLDPKVPQFKQLGNIVKKYRQRQKVPTN